MSPTQLLKSPEQEYPMVFIPWFLLGKNEGIFVLTNAAEQAATFENIQPPPRKVISLSETIYDRLPVERANRFIRNVGRMALLETEVETPPLTEAGRPEISSLMDGIHDAAWGSPEARSMVKANARPDFIERAIKLGIILTTKLQPTEGDDFVQHGQPMDKVYTNTLRYASATWQIRERSEAETRNGFRLKESYQHGRLRDGFFVVISRRANNMTDQQQAENGMFPDTATCVIQATTEQDGEVVMQSAFVAGRKSAEEESHDEETVVAMGEALGVDLSGKTAAQIIDTPLWIPKEMMPNGVIDLVKLYDICAGGTFFGESKPVQDYLEYEQFCREREESFEPIVEEIVDQLIAEADSIHTPLEAVHRLHKLSQQAGVKRSITDDTIDPRVFGETAADDIIRARHEIKLGNHEQAKIYERRAQSTAISYSCPAAYEKDEARSGDDYSGDESKGANTTDTSESKTGKIRCIRCREYVKKADVVKADCWECPKCQHKVDVCTGKTLNVGKLDSRPKKSTRILAAVMNFEEAKEKKVRREEKMPVAA